MQGPWEVGEAKETHGRIPFEQFFRSDSLKPSPLQLGLGFANQGAKK